MVELLRWLDDGEAAPCVLKRSTGHEGAIYADVLTEADGPRLLGRVAAGDAAWLFLERVAGPHPDFGVEAELREAFAWLGRMHLRHPALDAAIPPPPYLPVPAELARALAEASAPAGLCRQAVALLTAPARTLIHGDFHQGNLLRAACGLLAVDWERAGRAHPVWDLALLDPGGPGWLGVPGGTAALVALSAYHGAGPLQHLPRRRFLWLQRLACLSLTAARAERHRVRMLSLPAGGARAVVAAHWESEAAAARRLLGSPAP